MPVSGKSRLQASVEIWPRPLRNILPTARPCRCGDGEPHRMVVDRVRAFYTCPLGLQTALEPREYFLRRGENEIRRIE